MEDLWVVRAWETGERWIDVDSGPGSPDTWSSDAPCSSVWLPASSRRVQRSGRVQEPGGGRTRVASASARGCHRQVDDDGFTAYYTEHRARLVAAMRPLVGDAAEDVAQDAFIELHRRWSQVSGYDVPWAWLLMVARRTAGRRAARDVRRAVVEHAAGVEQAGADQLPGGDFDLRAALLGLPGRHATAIEIHHIQDRPLEQVALTLGCTEPAARVLVHRARRLLAARMAGYAGRWVSEKSWTAQGIADRLGELGASEATDVVLECHLGGRGGRWELSLHADGYRLARDDGLRLDDGKVLVGRGSLELRPRLDGGTVSLTARTDADRLSVQLDAITHPRLTGSPTRCGWACSSARVRSSGRAGRTACNAGGCS